MLRRRHFFSTTPYPRTRVVETKHECPSRPKVSMGGTHTDDVRKRYSYPPFGVCVWRILCCMSPAWPRHSSVRQSPSLGPLSAPPFSRLTRGVVSWPIFDGRSAWARQPVTPRDHAQYGRDSFPPSLAAPFSKAQGWRNSPSTRRPTNTANHTATVLGASDCDPSLSPIICCGWAVCRYLGHPFIPFSFARLLRTGTGSPGAGLPMWTPFS